MKNKQKVLIAAFIAILLLVGVSAYGQIHKYFSPGTVWEVTMIKIQPGMDQAYLKYLDTTLKQESEISIKNGFMKSYKILRSQDNDSGWNMLILREYDSYAAIEKNAEKADEVLLKETGIDDQKQMEGYRERLTIRDVQGTKYMRELILK
jgi:hypothetical protein